MRRRDDLVFPISEYERRLRELRSRMADRGLDVMLTTTPENICYLSGFESPGHYYFNALVVPMQAEPFAVPRRLEASGYEALSWLELLRPYEDYEDPINKLVESLREFGLADKRIGYERGCWFFTAPQQEQLLAACSQAEFVDGSGLIEEGRVVKSEHEIELMKRTAKATEAGMAAGIEAVRSGVTEDDVAAEIHYAMIKAGGQWPAIAPFVAAGERGAIGHATWMGKRIEAGQSVMLEVGGCIHRYHTATMRTVFVGQLDDEFQEAERVILEAMEAQMAAIRPGISGHEADAAGREVIANSRFGGKQGSRSAYSIGIGFPPDWGEGQILSMQPKEERALQANMTFHLLPWVQIPGKAGISLSETIRVTEDGCEALTHLDRKIATSS